MNSFTSFNQLMSEDEPWVVSKQLKLKDAQEALDQLARIIPSSIAASVNSINVLS